MGSAIFAPANAAFGFAALTGLVVARVAIAVLMMIGVYQLPAPLGQGVGMRVLYMRLILVPLVGLPILLMLNPQATGLLRRHGGRGGLMGPRVADLPVA